MAKSIRSKSKRKFRSEFRQTIGNDFYQKNMKQIQTKLKESVSNQTMSLESLERLSKAFDTSSSTPTTTDFLEEGKSINTRKEHGEGDAGGAKCHSIQERKLYRVGPNCETWPNTLTENPY